MQKIAIFLSALLLLPFTALAEEVIKPGETLTLRRCIDTAVKMHPDITVAAAAAQAGRQRIGQAEANYYPQIDLSLGYNKSESERISSNTSGSFNEFSGSASLRQTIYDFGKTTTQVNIEKFNADSSLSELDNIKKQIIFNVTEAYYGALRTKRQRDIAVEVVKQFEEHLEQAKGFFEAGTKPKFDVTKAEVDLSNARLNLLKANNALRIAKASLNNAMGISQTYVYEIHDDLSFSEYRITLDDAVKGAYDNRSDLKSLILRKNANSLSIDLARKDYYPTLSGNAEYSRSGDRLPLRKDWALGAAITFPLFSGFSTHYKVAEAKANLDTLKANEESLRQVISLEVQTAFLNLQDAAERVSVAETIVRQAGENLELSRGRYAAGVGSPIEVTDALVAYNNSKVSYISALYDYRVSQAGLEKAMGILK